jgi:hypothetical protein
LGSPPRLVHAFTIHPHECDLQLGDTVLPDTPIRLDFLTGKPVSANRRGTVASIRFGGEDDPLFVVVTPE